MLQYHLLNPTIQTLESFRNIAIIHLYTTEYWAFINTIIKTSHSLPFLFWPDVPVLPAQTRTLFQILQQAKSSSLDFVLTIFNLILNCSCWLLTTLCSAPPLWFPVFLLLLLLKTKAIPPVPTGFMSAIYLQQHPLLQMATQATAYVTYAKSRLCTYEFTWLQLALGKLSRLFGNNIMEIMSYFQSCLLIFTETEIESWHHFLIYWVTVSVEKM